MLTEAEIEELKATFRKMTEEAGGVICWTDGCGGQALEESDYCASCDRQTEPTDAD